MKQVSVLAIQVLKENVYSAYKSSAQNSRSSYPSQGIEVKPSGDTDINAEQAIQDTADETIQISP